MYIRTCMNTYIHAHMRRSVCCVRACIFLCDPRLPPPLPSHFKVKKFLDNNSDNKRKETPPSYTHTHTNHRDTEVNSHPSRGNGKLRSCGQYSHIITMQTSPYIMVICLDWLTADCISMPGDTFVAF